jgi:hypothetical protein
MYEFLLFVVIISISLSVIDRYKESHTLSHSLLSVGNSDTDRASIGSIKPTRALGKIPIQLWPISFNWGYIFASPRIPITIR